jgi:phosphate starvation-inducible protein PhoH
MADLERVSKLIGKIQSLISLLEQHRDLAIHQRVDQSYFMQKCSELELMCDQLKGAHAKKASFEHMVDASYREVATMWKEDIRWIKHYLETRNKPLL